jgi:hypothetical protein
MPVRNDTRAKSMETCPPQEPPWDRLQQPSPLPKTANPSGRELAVYAAFGGLHRKVAQGPGALKAGQVVVSSPLLGRLVELQPAGATSEQHSHKINLFKINKLERTDAGSIAAAAWAQGSRDNLGIYL